MIFECLRRYERKKNPSNNHGGRNYFAQPKKNNRSVPGYQDLSCKKFHTSLYWAVMTTTIPWD